jgi:hypothetical protein
MVNDLSSAFFFQNGDCNDLFCAFIFRIASAFQMTHVRATTTADGLNTGPPSQKDVLKSKTILKETQSGIQFNCG